MAEARKLHIVMFPWLAFGHMIPYLELAKLIAQKGHRVSFVSAPRNIDRLPKLPPNLLPFITFVKIPLPRNDGKLPEGAEATSDVPYEMIQHLNNAYDALEQPLSNFLQTSKPDWFLHDFVSYWAGPMAARVGVPCAFFSIFIPAFLGFLGPPSVLWDGIDDRSTPEEYTVSPKWVPFPSTVAYRYYEVKRIFDQASQLKILSHDSVGGILTHAGWSTVVEGFMCERALILLPFLADQGLNARVLEEKKLGYSIPRNERDGFFTAKSVAESLRLVMVDEEGKIYRDNAKEMKGLFGDNDRQERYVDNLLDYLSTHKSVKKACEANGVSKDGHVGV